MSIDFAQKKCQTYSNKKIFGICDDPPPASIPAYVDENNGANWIAVVVNDERYSVTFTAIDNCIEIRKPDRTMHKRCDGVLTYNETVILVELKKRAAVGNLWVEDGEKQLRTSIKHFEASDLSENFTSKRAYVANSEHPKFKSSQAGRMSKFFDETGYILRLENRIIL